MMPAGRVKASVHHHALQVSDLDRAVAFYAEAFGARHLGGPLSVKEDTAELFMDGPAGTGFRMSLIGLDDDILELFEFAADGVPPWAQRSPGRLPHLALEVEDVDDALARVEHAGGTRLFSAVRPFGSTRLIYASDPDGNVIELLEATGPELIALFRRYDGRSYDDDHH
jgi:predicted enzyme related to lactoylglutathione lyase